MSVPTPDHDRRLTRRHLLQAGAAAGALAALGGPGAPVAGAATPSYLRRSGYAGQVGTAFTARTAAGAPVTLRLAEVADLARAAYEPAFAGREDAFALFFTGPRDAVLAQGVHELRHATLGSFSLFLTPVGRAADTQAYELVIDRSVRFGDAADVAPEPLALSATAPAGATVAPPPPPAAGGDAATAGPADEVAGRPAPRKPGRVLRAAVARRGGVLSADVRVNLARRLVTVQVALVRDGVVLARGSARLRGRGAVRIPLRARGRVAGGEYTLVVTTSNKAGRRATTRRRAWLAR